MPLFFYGFYNIMQDISEGRFSLSLLIGNRWLQDISFDQR